jgi:uncharacterized membrane protein
MRLNRLHRITLVLFIIVVANWVAVSISGYSLMGGDLFTLFLIVAVLFLGLTLVWPAIKRLF